MSRLILRQDRILPGPLRSLRPERRSAPGVRGAVLPVVAAALAGAASLVALPRLAARPSADPAAAQGVAEAAAPAAKVDAPAKVVSLAPETPLPATARAPAAGPAVAVPAVPPAAGPAPVASQSDAPTVAAAPGRAVKPPSDRTAAPNASPFRLDLLPVLQTGDVDLDTSPAAMPAPVRAARPARRTAASNRDASTASP